MTQDRKDLSVAQVAVILVCSSRHVLNLINSGHFPNAYKMNPGKRSVYRIPKKDLDAFLKLRTVK
ncbi:MAG: helix-turn-helix domain-containing protein [Chloroflexi bacterium]|nr:helix-turn-helix domain-containing protein [Chloroflexota bacterium]